MLKRRQQQQHQLETTTACSCSLEVAAESAIRRFRPPRSGDTLRDVSGSKSRPPMASPIWTPLDTRNEQSNEA